MKFVKTFEDISNDDIKNNILILDVSASCYELLKELINSKNLYLSKTFKLFLCYGNRTLGYYDNFTITKLKSLLATIKPGWGDNVQEAIDFIKNKKIEGNILIISDGNEDLNFYKLDNVAYLSLVDVKKPRFIALNDVYFFINDLESSEQFYPPRDIITVEDRINWEIRKKAKKFNL